MDLFIPTPNTDVVRFEDISKKRLAAIVNKQNEELKQLGSQKKKLCDLLLAVAKTPEAFAVDSEGRVTIDMGAVGLVQENTTLHIRTYENDRYELTFTEPGPNQMPADTRSNIIIPQGGLPS